MLTQFTQPTILKQIGPLRLAKFFESFDAELKANNIVLPTMDYEKENDFPGLAAALVPSERLPGRLRKALFTLEDAASPENHDRLHETTNRRLPCISLGGLCDLDHALELWFAAPDELAQFRPPASVLRPPIPAPGVPDTTEIPNHRNTETLSPSDLTSDLRPLISAPSSSVLRPPSSGSTLLQFPEVEPWDQLVNGGLLLDTLAQRVKRFVVLPKWAAEALALFTLHTYAFKLRDVSTYIGIESPEKQCGKTTLLTVLYELANRAVAAANISPPAFFRVIEDLSPTLLIDEGDTFLNGNDQLRGILNSGYTRKTAFVLRATGSGPASNGDKESEKAIAKGGVTRFSCWCPKVIATIGRLPDTLADRCILIRIQRKTANEECERLRDVGAATLKRQCARFVLDNSQATAAARPQLPTALSDRAADIWEPLLALADLAGGHWPDTARQAAVGLSVSAQQSNPIGSLLLDILMVFNTRKAKRMFTRDLVESLNRFGDRPWLEITNGKGITDRELSQQLRPDGIKPKALRIGELVLKGYILADCVDVFRRYIPKSEFEALIPPPESSSSSSLPCPP